ncbi:DNA repair protein RAD5B [Lachnellula willkommii]|uniref:DNA repair protein RAD5B n=1 Tax=Lachnellula willkommii TaxID=215461 RepID=A0A559M9B0_9HELO|nr:DNA repair protein RAD5B [Lachnellula willkommii]
MASSKRPLNDGLDGAFEHNSYSNRRLPNPPYPGNSTNGSIFSFEDRSWDGLWSELLNAEFETCDHEQQLHSNPKTKTATLSHDTEGEIESWAANSLQQHPEPFLFQESNPGETSSSDTKSSFIEKMCYGMIHRILVQVKGDMSEVDAKLKANNQHAAGDYYRFSVGTSDHDSTEVVLRFPDHTEFGRLNLHISKALGPLIDPGIVILDAIGTTKALCEAIGRATKLSDARVRIDINVYGSERDAKNVGRHLSSNKVYLQRPDTQRPGTLYNNPHLLKFPDTESLGNNDQIALPLDRFLKFDDAGVLDKTIAGVYASLTRGTKLDKVEGDRRIETKLLPHQQEALDFLIQRENGPIPLEFCLWKPIEGDKNWYQHAVTKAKTRTPNQETGGGILADEMGMGKSLSILALIVSSHKVASEWIKTQASENSEHSDVSQKPSPATLVIVPSAILINEWLNEIKIHLDGTLRTLKYHGKQRKSLTASIENTDIVLTTYHTLVADFGEKLSPLHKINWFRVVLDEAHIIRRQTTTFYRAVSELKARSRWCLSGTPIQNRLEDIGALFAFIQARPFHSIAMFRRFVTIPFNESEERRAVATRNLTLLLESLCLRRSRELLHLPDSNDRLRVVEFSSKEREQYDQTMKTMNRALRQRAGESHSKNIFGMFQIQLQLRILCNHGTYQHVYSWNRRSMLNEREAALCSVGDTGQVNCSACRQSMPMLGSNNVYRQYTGSCTHVLCSECLEDNEQSDIEAIDCPLCAMSGVPLTSYGPRTGVGEGHETYLKHEGYSSKMAALISDIREDLWKKKSIVFSCWTNTLNLIERYLRLESLPFQRIDGECPLGRRQKILDEFSSTSAIPILIMTTGTGAYGLNLTAANRVFIIEPQWNPSVENQAISRAIRMRQNESVLVTRYIVKGTVEQEMRSQQERKLKMAEIGNSAFSQ